MPSRGLSDAVAQARTTVSPYLTRQEPFERQHILPVSTVSFLPANVVSNTLKLIIKSPFHNFYGKRDYIFSNKFSLCEHTKAQCNAKYNIISCRVDNKNFVYLQT